MGEDEPVPDGYRHVKYLFIRRPTFMTLAKRNPDVFSTFNAKDLSGQRIENLPDLQGLFHDLSVLFLRRPDQCRWFQNPDGERDIDTACQAIIYEPIKLSTVVSAAVMGIDRRHTQFAANDIGVKGTRLDDSVDTITFNRNGRFLPEPVQRYQVRNDEDYELGLTVFFNQDDEWTETFTRDTAKAVLSLVAPQPREKIDDFNLPSLSLDGRRIPLAILLDELLLQMPLRAAICVNVNEAVFTYKQAAREVHSYAARLQAKWHELGIPNNEMSIDLISVLIGEGERCIAAKIDICRESPQAERRGQHPNDQGLLYYAEVDMAEMQDAVFYQTVPVSRVVPLPGLRYLDRV